jgi:hypothetical protein
VVNALAVSADGKRLVTAEEDRVSQLWDGERLRRGLDAPARQ